MNKIKTLTTVDEIKAFTNPYCLEIFSTLQQLKKPATVKQIAVKMGELPTKVYYYLKNMEKTGLINVAFIEEIDGIIEKYYEPTAECFKIEKKKLRPELINEIVKEERLAFAAIYERNKELFLKHVENKTGQGTLSSGIVYLTDQEAEVISKKT